MDMMHSTVFAVPPKAPTGLTFTSNTFPKVDLQWTDNSLNETQFTIQRATDSNFTAGLTNIPYVNGVQTVPYTVTYQDNIPADNTLYWYRVIANNLVGDIATASFPTMTASSVSNTLPVPVGTVPTPPAAPTFVSATAQPGPQVSVTWTDNAIDETGFVVERCTGSGCTNFTQIAAPLASPGTGATVTYPDTAVTGGNTYRYQVKAVNAGGSSAYIPSPPVSVPVDPAPAAPTNVTVSAVKLNNTTDRVTLKWAWTGSNLTDFTIQRATDATFTTGLTTNPALDTDRQRVEDVPRRTKFYYRIRANGPGGSSAWVLASPFPITTP